MIKEDEKDLSEKEDLLDDEDEEESDEKEQNVDVFCIHNIKITNLLSRPECNKCRKNYYKLRKRPCDHFEQTEDCFLCGEVVGWIYKTKTST